MAMTRVYKLDAAMKIAVPVILIAAANLAFAASKIAPDVPKGNSSNLIEVIVRFKAAPGKDDLNRLGGQVKRSLDLIHAVHVALSQAAIQALENNPNVVYVSPNRALHGSLDITTQTVNAPAAWQLGWNGTGVGVAVIDSGIALKHDLTRTD